MASDRYVHWPDPSQGQGFELLPEGTGLPFEAVNRPRPLLALLLLALGGGGWALALSPRAFGMRGDIGDVFLFLLIIAGFACLVSAVYCLRSTHLRLLHRDLVTCLRLSARNLFPIDVGVGGLDLAPGSDDANRNRGPTDGGDAGEAGMGRHFNRNGT